MGHTQPEPIHALHHHTTVPHHVAPTGNPAQPGLRPPTIDALIVTIQQEFPHAHVRITGRGRTVERQAELMAQRRMQNRHQFLRTYLAAPHITEMDQWVANHAHAPEEEVDEETAARLLEAEHAGTISHDELKQRLGL